MSQAQQSLVSFINELQRVAGFLCELAEQRGPSRLYTNQLAVTPLHSAFLVLRRPTPSHLPMHGSSRSFAGNKRARGVPLLFFSTFRRTVLGVVSGLNLAARLSKARFEVVCDAAVQADIQVLDLLFLFGQASVKQLMAASHSLVKCFCGPGATPLSADAETAGGVMARLIKGNAITPKDEASKQIDKDGLENYCDQLVDDCGDARATSWWQRAPRMGLCHNRTASRTQSANPPCS